MSTNIDTNHSNDVSELMKLIILDKVLLEHSQENIFSIHITITLNDFYFPLDIEHIKPIMQL